LSTGRSVAERYRRSELLAEDGQERHHDRERRKPRGEGSPAGRAFLTLADACFSASPAAE
jgi:hypothetical protein